MIALLQRVSKAKVEVENSVAGEISAGLLVFLGIERNDNQQTADRLLQRVLKYRVFNDENGRMNLNLKQSGGGLLLVSQFTLAADTRSGLRPSFTPAADPASAQTLHNYMLSQAMKIHDPVACGKFGADMQVSLVNDGPVTFWLQQQNT